MHNNKGQVLVMFILLIPLFIMLFAYLVNSASLYIAKSHIENSVKDAISEGLNKRINENITDDELSDEIKKLINLNINNIETLKVSLNDNVTVKIKCSVDSAFGNIFKNDDYSVFVIYSGKVIDGKIIIERDS